VAVGAVATGVAAVAQRLPAVPQLPLAAAQHQQQARPLVEPGQHRQQPQVRPLVEPEQHRHLPQARPRRAERKQLPAVEAEGVAVAISPALPTLMAPSTPDSARWLATRTACRR